MGILIVGFFFLLIPSAAVGIVEFLGLGIFKSIGPFYTMGLLIAGVCNSFLYIGLHLELREAAKRLTGINYTTISKITVNQVGPVHRHS